MNWLRHRKYLALLTAVLLLLVVYPILLAVAPGVPTLVSLWAGYFLPEVPRAAALVGFHLIASAFLTLCVGVVLLGIHRANRVSFDDICGALCGYLLLGLIFGHLYCVVEWMLPGSFVCAGAPLG